MNIKVPNATLPPTLPKFDWRVALDRCIARRDELNEADDAFLLTVTLNVKVRCRTPNRAQMRWLRDIDCELRGAR